MRALAAMVLLLVLAPAAHADQQSDLAAARDRWAAAGLKDYRFHVRRSCFCPPPYTRRYRVDVVGGRAFDAPKWIREIDTVPKLFALIQEEIDGDGSVDVAYADSGLPTSIGADPIPMAVDDEFSISADGLKETDDTPPRPVDDSIEDGSAAAALADARARWEEAGVERYRYRLLEQCFCAIVRPRTITVRDGREPPLFGAIERAIRKRSSGLDVRYGKTGFPRLVRVDPNALIADEELTSLASRLRALP